MRSFKALMFTLILILFLAYKHVVMGQNSDASKYEYLFFARSMYLCSNFMLRHQGGAEVKDVMTYFRETFDQSSNSFGLITTAQSVFLKMMGGLVKNMIEQPENLSKAIEALLGYDQLNGASLCCLEHVARRFQLIIGAH